MLGRLKFARLLGAAISLPLSQAFYLPGTAPQDYQAGDKIEVQVNSLSPMLKSNIKSLISHDYYDPRLHFCQPEGGPQKQPESLGSILWGDRIFNSPFEINMLENVTCKSLCKAVVPADDARFINQLIKDDYGNNWMIDGLPAAEMKRDLQTGEVFYDIGGFALGTPVDSSDQPCFNNHYDIYIHKHQSSRGSYRIVGVLVYPRSVQHSPGSDKPDCFSETPVHLSEAVDSQLWFSYSVSWVDSDVPWALRWDMYLHVFDPKIHWFWLINGLVVVVFLILMVGSVLARNVSKDIARYNAVDLSEDVQEDVGWKLVHGEVFRSPQRVMLLSAFTGSGVQLVCIAAVTLVFALFGFLSPANRGGLATMLLIGWTLFSAVSGYVSARVFGSMRGEDWKSNLTLTATGFPVFVFSITFLLNFWLIGSGASGAVPFGTMLAILALYFLISGPLCVAGYFYGMRQGPIEPPVRTNSIPRQVPPAPVYLRKWPSVALGGALPFGAAFVELYFMLTSLFGHRAYYAFGFLFLTFAVVNVTAAAITVLLVYFVLCAEEYRWHWRAFMIGGASSLWLSAYGTWYWISRLSFDGFSSVVLYFGYLFLFATMNFLMLGSVGFLASYFVVHRLYSSIRVE